MNSNMTPEQHFFRSIPQLSVLENDRILDLAKKTVKRKYQKEEFVFFQGDNVDHLYFLEMGKIEIYKSDINGRKLTLWHIEESEIFCLANLYSPEAFASAVVIEDALIYSLLQSDFEEIIASSQELSRNLIRCVCGKLASYSNFLDDIAFKKVEVRLAKTLLSNQRLFEGNEFVCRLSQDELASMVGSRREVIARCLKSFRERNLLRIASTGRPRSIIIENYSELQQIAEQE